MPHSGGGGSHSGGSSSSSSRSYSGGSHSGGSSSSSKNSSRHKTVVSNKPFKGSHTYVVYNKRGDSRIVYSNDKNYHSEMTKKELKSEITSAIASQLGFLLFGLIELIGIIVILCFGYQNGVRETVAPPETDRTVYIYDEYDLVSESDEKSLKKTLEMFRIKTGIIPAIEFTVDEKWNVKYPYMENFAYNEYIRQFSDEYHLLIVYSYGPVNPKTDFHEFHWESMWGDNLSKTASEQDEQYLASIMQENLTRANGKDVASAIGTSFDDFYEHLNRKQYHLTKGMICVCLFLLMHGGVFAGVGLSEVFKVVKKYSTGKKNGEETYKIVGNPVALECEYCGTKYYKGTIENCKNCGAPLRNT